MSSFGFPDLDSYSVFVERIIIGIQYKKTFSAGVLIREPQEGEYIALILGEIEDYATLWVFDSDSHDWKPFVTTFAVPSASGISVATLSSRHYQLFASSVGDHSKFANGDLCYVVQFTESADSSGVPDSALSINRFKFISNYVLSLESDFAEANPNFCGAFVFSPVGSIIGYMSSSDCPKNSHLIPVSSLREMTPIDLHSSQEEFYDDLAKAISYKSALDKLDLLFVKLGSALARKDYWASIRIWGNILAFQPRNASYLLARGRLYKEVGDVVQAVCDFRLSIEFDRGCLDAYLALAGILLFDLGDPRQALDVLTLPNSSLEPNSLFHWLKYRCYFDLDELNSSLIEISSAISLQPVEPQYYCDKASLLLRLGRYPESLSHYKMAIECGLQMNLNVVEEIANTYLSLGDYDSAIRLYEVYEGSLSLNDDMGSVLFQKAGLFLATGNFQEAEDSLLHSIRVAPQSICSYGILAALKFYLGQYESALKILSHCDIHQKSIFADSGQAVNIAYARCFAFREPRSDFWQFVCVSEYYSQNSRYPVFVSLLRALCWYYLDATDIARSSAKMLFEQCSFDSPAGQLYRSLVKDQSVYSLSHSHSLSLRASDECAVGSEFRFGMLYGFFRRASWIWLVFLSTLLFILLVNPRVGILWGDPYVASCGFQVGIYFDSNQSSFRLLYGLADGGVLAPLIDVRSLIGCR